MAEIAELGDAQTEVQRFLLWSRLLAGCWCAFYRIPTRSFYLITLKQHYSCWSRAQKKKIKLQSNTRGQKLHREFLSCHFLFHSFLFWFPKTGLTTKTIKLSAVYKSIINSLAMQNALPLWPTCCVPCLPLFRGSRQSFHRPCRFPRRPVCVPTPAELSSLLS